MFYKLVLVLGNEAALFEMVQRLLGQNRQLVEKAKTIHNNLIEALGRQQSALENIFYQQRPITEQDYSIINIFLLN
jgi:hypothetical protein